MALPTGEDVSSSSSAGCSVAKNTIVKSEKTAGADTDICKCIRCSSDRRVEEQEAGQESTDANRHDAADKKADQKASDGRLENNDVSSSQPVQACAAGGENQQEEPSHAANNRDV